MRKALIIMLLLADVGCGGRTLVGTSEGDSGAAASNSYPSGRDASPIPSVAPTPTPTPQPARDASAEVDCASYSSQGEACSPEGAYCAYLGTLPSCDYVPGDCTCTGGYWVCPSSIAPSCDAGPRAQAGCPATEPSADDACTGSASCNYGTETCCGASYPSVICDCTQGFFSCYPTDACLMPVCGNDGG
jgi:hypothetical protein